MLAHLDTLIFDLAAFAGLGTESMTRARAGGSSTWAAASSGPPDWCGSWRPRSCRRRLPVEPADGAQRIEEMLLEIADSSMTYRNRYLGMLEPAPLIDLLVTDETNPRSIAFQFAALADHVAPCPARPPRPVLSGERRAVLEALAAVRLADVDGPGRDRGRPATGRRFGGCSSLLAAASAEFSESLTHRYLVHAMPQRRLGDATVVASASPA